LEGKKTYKKAERNFEGSSRPEKRQGYATK